MPLRRYITNRVLHYGSDRVIDRITRAVRTGERDDHADVPDKPVSWAEGIRNSLLGGIATRLATRSVPGAIIVGGALLAKTLYDRKHTYDARPNDEDRSNDENRANA